MKAVEVDFLTAGFAMGGVMRDGGEFAVARPWAMARIADQPMRGGWWLLECEGEGDVSGVEVRVSSPRDPLIIFPGSGGAARVLLRDFDNYDLALLVSPWPGRFRFSTLKLRRLTSGEEARFLMSGVGRLLRSRDPVGVARRMMQRLVAGQSVGVAARPARQPSPPPAADPPEFTAVREASTSRVERHGDVEAVLGAHDRLHPQAFGIVAAEFARSPGLQAVYADVREGGRIVPHPAFDRVLAAAVDYIGQPVFFRAGGQSGASAWDRLMLAAKGSSDAVGRIALPLAERPAPARPVVPVIPQPMLDPAPRVSVVIPTRFRVDMLEKGLKGLREATGYPGLQMVVVDNGSTNPRLRQVINATAATADVLLIEDRGAFNFSRLVNAGVRQSTGEVVLLLNDDVTPVETGWLHRMVQSALTPGVGAVGARLTYPDGSIQHAGVMLGLGGVAGHLWKGTSKADAAQSPYIACPGSRLAVTGACLAVRRSVFEEVGGFDETFPVAFNDVDFCLRLYARGLRNVYRGDAVLVHHEGQSRGRDDDSIAKRKRLAVETKKFLDRWKTMTWDDPFGSPAFDPLLESGAVHRSLMADQASSPA